MKTLYLKAAVCLLFLSVNTFGQTFLCQAKDKKKELWGYIDLKGNFVIPPIYARCYEFRADGFASIFDQDKGRYYFIDRKGNRLNTAMDHEKFENAGMGFNIKGFSGGVVPVMIRGSMWGVIDTTGKVIFPFEFEKISEFKDGFAAARLRNDFYILNSNGTRNAIKIKNLRAIREITEGRLIVEIGDYEGMIDTTGKEILPAEYFKIGTFSAGMAWVYNRMGFRYIDKTGKFAIEMQFNKAFDFDPVSGLARVKKDQQWGYIDTTGKFYTLNDTRTFNDFHEGYCTGRIGEFEGFYDKTGKWIKYPCFQDMRNFSNGYAAAKSDGLWGIVDTQGEWVVKPAFLNLKDVQKLR